MDDYFAKRAPFGDGKKKSEFPDAFAVAAIKKWLAENAGNVTIVSADGDFAAVCETNDRMEHEPRLEKYLQEVGEFHAALLSFLIDLAKQHQDEIEAEIETRFTELGFWLEDQNGDVENVVVQDVSLDNMFVIRIDDNVATLELTARIAFTCDLHYDDMNTAVYDSEDKRYIILNRITEDDVERDEEIPVELRVAFDLEDREYFHILDMKLNQGKDIGVLQDNEYPYK